jgi:hypothetical protein
LDISPKICLVINQEIEMAKTSGKEAVKKVEQLQIYNLFAIGEKLIAAKVSMRLTERTGGRKELSDVVVIQHLEVLVSEGKLVKDITPLIVSETRIKKTEYPLPEKKEG